MRTNINDDAKKATVDKALRLDEQLQKQAKVRELWGTVKWEGDLEQSRLGHIKD